MEHLLYIHTKLKRALEKSGLAEPELTVVAEELVPSVLTSLITDHKDTLETFQKEMVTLSDEELLKHVHIQRVLDDSIEKVARMYVEAYGDISLGSSVHTIIANDLATLLKQDQGFWERAKKKTYQEIMNDAHPGSNDERVHLWLEEIKKTTGVAPETNESVGTYSARAIREFLTLQKNIKN